MCLFDGVKTKLDLPGVEFSAARQFARAAIKAIHEGKLVTSQRTCSAVSPSRFLLAAIAACETSRTVSLE